jgi:hypothetical protein
MELTTTRRNDHTVLLHRLTPYWHLPPAASPLRALGMTLASFITFDSSHQPNISAPLPKASGIGPSAASFSFSIPSLDPKHTSDFKASLWPACHGNSRGPPGEPVHLQVLQSKT